jgi:hypothetical protein
VDLVGLKEEDPEVIDHVEAVAVAVEVEKEEVVDDLYSVSEVVVARSAGLYTQRKGVVQRVVRSSE